MWQIERFVTDEHNQIAIWEPVSATYQSEQEKLSLESALACTRRLSGWRRKLGPSGKLPWPGQRPHRIRNMATNQIVML